MLYEVITGDEVAVAQELEAVAAPRLPKRGLEQAAAQDLDRGRVQALPEVFSPPGTLRIRLGEEPVEEPDLRRKRMLRGDLV